MSTGGCRWNRGLPASGSFVPAKCNECVNTRVRKKLSTNLERNASGFVFLSGSYVLGVLGLGKKAGPRGWTGLCRFRGRKWPDAKVAKGAKVERRIFGGG